MLATYTDKTYAEVRDAFLNGITVLHFDGDACLQITKTGYDNGCNLFYAGQLVALAENGRLFKAIDK